MKKTIDLKASVSDICAEYPAVKDILVRLGFRDLARPGMLNTVGRFMTIPRGASMRGIDLAAVVRALQAGGFAISEAAFSRNIGGDDAIAAGVSAEDSSAAGVSAAADGSAAAPAAVDGSAADVSAAADTSADREARAALLREYVRRLSQGDSLEAVRADFVAHFRSVEAAEIAKAEQDLIESGTPVAEVQKLCDVHSALFHGATREEQLAGAEQAVAASAKKAAGAAAARSLAQIPGHPLSVLAAENGVIARWLRDIRVCAAGADDRALTEKLNAVRAAAAHTAKKGDLLYPLLKSRYGVSGPADVMWGVDDEIRDELKILAEAGKTLPHFAQRLDRMLTRAEEMIYKENNILFPLCAQYFTAEDWSRIYAELPAYDSAFFGARPVWAEAAAGCGQPGAGSAASSAAAPDGVLPLGSGHMTLPQIEAVLNTIPLELSFVDENDINRFFNAGEKLFRRPADAVDREVYACHPPKYAAMARQIIGNLRAGRQDSVDVWMRKGGEPVFVRYMAVRDSEGKYVGTLECVQKMGFAKEHFARS